MSLLMPRRCADCGGVVLWDIRHVHDVKGLVAREVAKALAAAGAGTDTGDNP